MIDTSSKKTNSHSSHDKQDYRIVEKVLNAFDAKPNHV